MRVQVVMTRYAQQFIQPLTFAALTGEKVLTDLFAGDSAEARAAWDFESSIEHISAAQSASAMVVAPATAHTLARFAHGLADDFLTTLYLATPAPVILAPAMNVEMWCHPATQQNVRTLEQRGNVIVAPQEGYLACGMVGAGRLTDLDLIVQATLKALRRPAADLDGETVLITAGPTREPLDPVRYLSNRSSGRMGYALAQAAAERGARVILVTGPTSLPAPQVRSPQFPDGAIETVRVQTAEEMAAATTSAWPTSAIAILAAAVADYQAAQVSPVKLKKTGERQIIELTPTRDILAELGRTRQHQFLAGFAAETEAVRDEPGNRARALARGKLEGKGADLIVLNDVSRTDIGFDVDHNAVTLISREREVAVERSPKPEIAHRILDEILALRKLRAESAATNGTRS
jgi:phosphopantothenoylcysteine decarboxylase/phosphopantothenate--cysteine ligase